MMSNNTGGEVWIYHERQQDLLCGQHALNNLIQESIFSPEALAVLAQDLDAKELQYMSENNEGGTESKEYLQRMQEGSGNVDAHGNFSIQVLRQALQNQYGLELPNIRQQGINQQEPTTMEGFICNKHSHWFAIRKINGRYWNLNSTKDLPELISHFNLAKEIEKLYQDGYSVFCVSNSVTLPPACWNASEMEKRKERQQRSVNGNWWKESDLVSGKANTIVNNNRNNNNNGGQNNNNGGSNGSGDPWKNVGSGMRLDGRSTTTTTPSVVALPPDVAGALTEEEQLQFAMAASFQATATTTTSNSSSDDPIVIVDDVEVPDEPPAGTPGSVRIQFRLPTHPRLVRRFMETDSVKVLLSFCKQQENGANDLDLRYGFPPKDLKLLADQTIGEAKLAGQSIQGRRI